MYNHLLKFGKIKDVTLVKSFTFHSYRFSPLLIKTSNGTVHIQLHGRLVSHSRISVSILMALTQPLILYLEKKIIIKRTEE